MTGEKQSKAELQEELERLGQDTEGSKTELEERLQSAKEASGEVSIQEADPEAVKANEKFAEEQRKEAQTDSETPAVYEARKVE